MLSGVNHLRRLLSMSAFTRFIDDMFVKYYKGNGRKVKSLKEFRAVNPKAFERILKYREQFVF